MSKTSHSLIRKFKRRLDKYVAMEQTHCGHEGPEMEAERAREKLIDWLGAEIEKCERAAVVESVRNGGPG